ncbi:hypothetical protein Nit79A3_0962 [Nitrosomonas sp. Is79A3]|uniref:hypothetical protein n=1 Tax=Nitrosomonas sp. (strain Is79A3) TaxID=261292 RepID=UPI000215D489
MNQEYEDRYCLFLDILGFQSHVDETIKGGNKNKSAMTFTKLKGALDQISVDVHYRDAVEISGKLRSTSRRVTQFSDSVIVSYLRNEPHGTGVTSILMDVHNLQLALLQRGILLRGAITAGQLYHDEKLVFGPALNEAVALERLANYPRVILDGEILDEAGLKRSPSPSLSRTINSMVAEDFDGLFYIDYFNIHPDDFNEDWVDVQYYLEKLRAVVKGLSNKKDPSIKVKHSWLRTKFNLMAKPFQKSGYKTLGICTVPEDDVALFQEIKPF